MATKTKSKPKFENQFCMRCPECGETSGIDVAAVVNVRLMRDGSDADESVSGDHEWDDASFAFCADCGYSGTVRDFQTFYCAACEDVVRRASVVNLSDNVGNCPECGGGVFLLEDEEEMED